VKRSAIQRLLLLYPAKWRNEYGAELEDLLLTERLRFIVVLNVVWSALRQQVRISNHPAGLVRSLALMSGGVGAVFVLSMILSVPLWRLILLPMAEALAQSGRPPRLIQEKPFEGFAILWLGLPLLVTAFVAYPFMLCLVRVKVASTWTPQRKRWATAFVIWSGSLFFLSGVSGLVAWEHGVVLTLRGFEPLMRHTSIMTVSACFGRFARSILEFGILVQIPVLAFFITRIKKSFWTQTLK
jgi:Sec-independent protein secretion pathway component TatC